MPYLGKTPASEALATSDLADNIITEAKMADDAIALTELKAGTDGELITWDASGNPAAVGVGTSGHYLKSQGAGDVPVFAAVEGAYDLQGAKLTLDANANTSITADTDDQIDIEISGADDFTFTANSFNVLSGSQIDMNGTKLVLDANANTSITADTDDQIDIEIAGADDFQFTANTFTIPSGSTVAIAAGGAITNAGTMAPDISSTGKSLVFGN
jgi:hypothetical protein